MNLPYLTAYDPPGASEGTLDPLGLYLIADQLATRLVPAVRERMQRIRFLTPITVGALITEDLEPNDRHPQVLPYLVWEWFVVEAIVRTFPSEDDLWGVPGSLVTRRAISEFGYVDERSYLKTPRVFGLHGVYKRLAMHLGLVDAHLQFRAPHGVELVHAWARDLDLGRFDEGHHLYQKWRKAVEYSLSASPVCTRTSPRWTQDDWRELAEAFVPHQFRRREKQCLTRLLHATGDGQLGAFVAIWNLLENLDEQEFDEHTFHNRLRTAATEYEVPLDAISAYEAFCRGLTDAFDILRAEGSRHDVRGFRVTSLRDDEAFRRLAEGVAHLHLEALHRLSEADPLAESRFAERFTRFSEPMPAEQFAMLLCEHHEAVQREKSREGKRSWFDRIGDDRIYVRANYRPDRPTPAPESYVHEYRMHPIQRFYRELR